MTQGKICRGGSPWPPDNKLLGNGPAQGPAPTGLSLFDIINHFKLLTRKRVNAQTL